MSDSDKSILNELEGEGWIKIDPPELTNANRNLIGYYDNEPIKVGFGEEVRGQGTNQEVTIYRSGPYKVWHNKKQTTNGTIHQVKVVEAE